MSEYNGEVGPQRQASLFERTDSGDGPQIPFDHTALRDAALETLDDLGHAYVTGNAGAGETAVTNRDAFQQWGILPRMLEGVADRDLSVDLLGRTLPVPFVLAPIGIQTLYDSEGAVATARASADLGFPMCVSTVTSRTFETVADRLDTTPKWAQLYIPTDEAVTESFVDRVERAGYDAIVITVDTPYTGWRKQLYEAGQVPLDENNGVANFFTDPAFRDRLPDRPEEDPETALSEMITISEHPGMTWETVADISERTTVPVLVKGLLHPADAKQAASIADGVVVSNHGGRQVDGSVAPMEVLPDIAAAVGDDVPVVFDSGVRTGADAFKALALGADVVGFGRPYIYGLAIAGENGVREVAANFVAEFDITLALAGHTSPADLTPDALYDRR